MIYARIPSGIEILDRIWGGFYKGRTYLIVGPNASGKTILSLQFLSAGLNQGERCVFVTERRVEDLVLQLESFGFGIKKHLAKDRLRFLRFPLAPPEKTTQMVNDLFVYLESEEIQRLVIDTIIPLIMPDPKDFHALIEDMLYRLEQLEVSTLMTIKEPANLLATRVVNMLEELTTGIIRFSETPSYPRIHFKVKWGYPTTVFSYDYKIVPSQGIVISDEKEAETPQPRAGETKFEFTPFNNFLNLIVKQMIAPTKPTFSVVAIKFSTLSQRALETVELCLSEIQPATLYQNSVLIFLPTTGKRGANLFSKELGERIKSMLPSCQFDIAVVTFPEDGEDLDELLSKIT